MGGGPGRFTSGNDLVPSEWEAEWSLRPDLRGAENATPNGIQSPDPPARIEWLY